MEIKYRDQNHSRWLKDYLTKREMLQVLSSNFLRNKISQVQTILVHNLEDVLPSLAEEVNVVLYLRKMNRLKLANWDWVLQTLEIVLVLVLVLWENLWATETEKNTKGKHRTILTHRGKRLKTDLLQNAVKGLHIIEYVNKKETDIIIRLTPAPNCFLSQILNPPTIPIEH